jgi:3-isopropylmalate dehydratase small subunit
VTRVDYIKRVIGLPGDTIELRGGALIINGKPIKREVQPMLSVPVEQDVIEQLWAAIEDDPTTRITVDLEARTVTCGDLVAPFQIDDYTRWRLLNGLDDIGITLGNEADIAAFEATRPSFKPVTQ